MKPLALVTPAFLDDIKDRGFIETPICATCRQAMSKQGHFWVCVECRQGATDPRDPRPAA